MARDPTSDPETAASTGATSAPGHARLRRGQQTSATTTATAARTNTPPLLSTTNLHAHTRSTAGGSSSPAPSVVATPTAAAASAAAALRRRRSSTFSDYSQDARDLLNPSPLGTATAASLQQQQQQPLTSKWDTLPLAFALLPAVGGLLVPGGGAFVTDLMLLGLGALFLHWSVTQPWTWYHAARQIREEHEAQAELSMQGEFRAALGYGDTDDDDEDGMHDDHVERMATPTPTPALADVQEEDETGESEAQETPQPKEEDGPTPLHEPVAAAHDKQRARRQRERRRFQTRQAAALRALRRHELASLVACFGFPLLGAYLLHALRAQLTRPSEGLISNYNLTIFLLGAEVRPLRHLLQLVQARTLHLQRVVHANPFREEEEQYRARRAREEREQNQALVDVVRRVAELEAARTGGAEAVLPASETKPAPPDAATRDALLRDVRAQLQPELDALARALRRTHKQQTLLEGQVAARFRVTEQRMDRTLAAKRGAPSSSSGSSGSVSAALLSGALIDAFWMLALWAAETVLAGALAVARTATAAAAAVLAVPLWPVQAVGALFTGDDIINDENDNDNGNDNEASASPTIVSGHIVKGGHRGQHDESFYGAAQGGQR